MALAFIAHRPSRHAFPGSKTKTKKTTAVVEPGGPSRQQSSPSCSSTATKTARDGSRRVAENEGMNDASRYCPEDGGESPVGEAGEALLGFLEHYSRFDYERWGVSTARGFFRRGQHEGAGALGDLFVEDPFEGPRTRNNVAQSVYRVTQLKALFAATLRDLTLCSIDGRAVSERQQVQGGPSSTTCIADDSTEARTISSPEALVQRLGSSFCWYPVAGKTPQTSPSIGQPQQVTWRAVSSSPAQPPEPPMRTGKGGNLRAKRCRRRSSRSSLMRPAHPALQSQPVSSFQPAQLPQLSQSMQLPQASQHLLQTPQQPSSQNPSESLVHDSVPIIPAPKPKQLSSNVPIPISNTSRAPTSPKKGNAWGGKSTVADLALSPRSVVVEHSFPALPSLRRGNVRT